MKTIGDMIREERDNAGLTQEGLAAKVGYTYQHIGYVERDEHQPSLALLRRIAEALDLDLVVEFRRRDV